MSNATLEPWTDFLLRMNKEGAREGRPPVSYEEGRALILSGQLPAEKIKNRWFIPPGAKLPSRNAA